MQFINMEDGAELDDMMIVTVVEDEELESAQNPTKPLLEFESLEETVWEKYFDEQYETDCYKNISTGKVSWVRPDGYSTPRQESNKDHENSVERTSEEGTIFTAQIPRWSDGYKPTASILGELPSTYDSEGEEDETPAAELEKEDAADEGKVEENSEDAIDYVLNDIIGTIEASAREVVNEERELKMLQSMSIKVCELMIIAATEEVVHQIMLERKPKSFDEELEAINMEAEDRNYFKEADYEAKRQERLRQAQEVFGLTDNDDSADELIEVGIEGGAVMDLGKMIESSLEKSRKEEELARKKREREMKLAAKRRKNKLAEKKKKFWEEEYAEDENARTNKQLVDRYDSVSKTLRMRMELAKSTLITESQRTLELSSIAVLDDINEVTSLLKKIEARLPGVRELLINGPPQKRKPKMKLAREKYNEKARAKRKWSPEIERKRLEERNLTPLVLPLPTKYNAPPLTKLEQKKIEEDISQRVEAMRQDLIKRKKKAKIRHAKREKMWARQRLEGANFNKDRLQTATERRIKAEKLTAKTLARFNPHPLVSYLFRRLGTQEQDRLIRIALVAAGEAVPRNDFDRRDVLERWLEAVGFKRRDAPVPPRTIDSVERYISNLKRSHQMLNFDDTDLSDMKSKTQVTTGLGRTILAPVDTSPIKSKSPKGSRSKRTVIWSPESSGSYIVERESPQSPKVRVDRTTFGGSNTIVTIEDDDDQWRKDYNKALQNARAVRNSYKKRKKVEKRPQLSPIKKAPLPMDFDQRAVLKNEISRQATIETMEQVGFLWEEAEDMEATDERPFADAPKRRARSHSEFSPAFQQLQQQEYLKYEAELAEEAERKKREEIEAGIRPPDEFSQLYKEPANIMDAIKNEYT